MVVTASLPSGPISLMIYINNNNNNIGILMAIAKKVDHLYIILMDRRVTDNGLLILLNDPILMTLWHYHLGHLLHQALLKMSIYQLFSNFPALQVSTLTS